MDKCPFCGAKRSLEVNGAYIFKCQSRRYDFSNPEGEFARSSKCYEAELAALKSRLAQVEYDYDNLKEVTAQNDYLERRLAEAEGLLRAVQLSSCPCGLDHFDAINAFLTPAPEPEEKP